MGRIIFAVLFIYFSVFAEAQVFRKAPYLLYPGSNSRMLIVWQLYSSLPCSLYYGIDSSNFEHSLLVTESDDSHLFKILLDSLLPGTKYYYRVNCNGDIREGSFYTGPEDSAKNVVFYAYGDTRTYPENHNLVAKQILNTIETEPESQTIILASGDLVTDGDLEESWDDEFFNPNFQYIQKMLANLPYMATMGNHEGQGVLFAKYFPYPMFQNNSYYYSFDYGPVHFTVVDQYTDYSEGSPQYQWLVEDLASTDKPWKFILLHEPGWSAGGHSNDWYVQNIIQPLCIEYGVQFVIAGHNHYYARAVVDGVMHITTGGGGAPLYDCSPTYPNIVKCESTYHFCKFDIENDTLTFTAIRSDGSIIETFRTFSFRTYIADLQPIKLWTYVNGNTVKIISPQEPVIWVEVFDVIGKKVLTTNAKSFVIQQKGIYILRIRTLNHLTVRKILIY